MALSHRLGALVLLVGATACRRSAAIDLRPTRDDRAGLASEIAESGAFSDRLARPDLADVVLLYGAEAGGALGPCGCDKQPRGGLARVQTYADATRARSPSTAVWMVDAGGWLDSTLDFDGVPRLDAMAANDWMVKGLRALHPVALNVSWSDLSTLRGFSTPPDLPLVSAQYAGPGIVPVVERSVNGQRVLFTGIGHTGPTMLVPEGFTMVDPVDGVRAALASAGARPEDLVVLLSSEANTAGTALAEEGLVDVVIDARQHRYRDPPFRAGDAVWVKAHHQTLRLGELRLQVQAGRAARALDRKIDLDDAVPSDPTLARWAKQAEREVQLVRQTRYGL